MTLWKGFQKPKRLDIDTETLTPTYGKFYAQPFERGFGTTDRQRPAPRAALLDRGRGHHGGQDRGRAARVLVAAGRRRGRDRHHPQPQADPHQDAHHRGEDPHDRRRAQGQGHGRRPPGRLGHRDPGSGRAGRHALGERSLRAELRVSTGRGYVSADKNFDDDMGIGYIPIDSVHSPVRRVNYHVEAARIGQATDYDRLVLEVWTNGTISPTDAVGLAATLLRDHLTIFVNADHETALEGRRGRRAAGEPGGVPQQVRRRAGALGPQRELPQERGHPDDPRPRAAHREGHARDQELRPQVSQRDQGHPPARWACPSGWSSSRSKPRASKPCSTTGRGASSAARHPTGWRCSRTSSRRS